MDEPPRVTAERSGRDYLCQFRAMATPCEIRVETDEAEEAELAAGAAMHEALRIEQKYSRYRSDSVVGQMNAKAGERLTLDDETSKLIDFSAQCFVMSSGRFDITSGILRQVWRFDGSDHLPSAREVRAVAQHVGWRQVEWRAPVIRLKPGMEIDLGGVGKEYAVDRALAQACRHTQAPLLVNFGGDLCVSGPRRDGTKWRIAIESVDRHGEASAMLEIARGALATSGDARRYILKNGVRYSHILDPRSGWPVKDPPRSVTVAAKTCLEAGTMATLAMLRGPKAEAFLKQEKAKAWVIR